MAEFYTGTYCGEVLCGGLVSARYRPRMGLGGQSVVGQPMYIKCFIGYQPNITADLDQISLHCRR